MERKEKMDFINLFVNEELIDMMVMETNRYSDQEIDRCHPLRRTSRYRFWKPVNAEEVNKFIGFLYLMGIVRLPTIEHYWSRNVLNRFNGCYPKTGSRRSFDFGILPIAKKKHHNSTRSGL